jgi:hypothetical protein
MASATERAQGRLLSKHRTDDRRRTRSALRALATGTAAAVVALAAFAAGLPPYAGGAALAVALVSLWRGTARALAHRRLGAEVFMVRERALIHRRGGALRVVPWERVTAVRTAGRAAAARRLFGHDVVCRVALADGEVLKVTAYTQDTGALAEAVAARAGQAAPVRTRTRTPAAVG